MTRDTCSILRCHWELLEEELSTHVSRSLTTDSRLFTVSIKAIDPVWVISWSLLSCFFPSSLSVSSKIPMSEWRVVAEGSGFRPIAIIMLSSRWSLSVLHFSEIAASCREAVILPVRSPSGFGFSIEWRWPLPLFVTPAWDLSSLVTSMIDWASDPNTNLVRSGSRRQLGRLRLKLIGVSSSVGLGRSGRDDLTIVYVEE